MASVLVHGLSTYYLGMYLEEDNVRVMRGGATSRRMTAFDFGSSTTTSVPFQAKSFAPVPD